MEMIDIRFRKLHPEARIPTKGTPGSAGYDLYTVGAPDKIVDAFGETLYEYHSGLAVEIPPGFFIGMYPRSSLTMKGLTLSNGVGVIDSDYRGEIMFRLRVTSPNVIPPAESGLRLVQAVIHTYSEAHWLEVDQLSESKRGKGGYGSTGH